MLDDCSSFPGALSLSRHHPCYDPECWLVKEVEGIARHLLAILAVRRNPRLLKYPDRDLSLEEIAAFDFGDDGDDWLIAMLRNPNCSDFRRAIDNYVESIFIADGDEAALDAEAIGLRNKWNEWTVIKTAALCVVMTEGTFQLEFINPTTIPAETFWTRLLSIHRELCKDADKAVPRNGKQPARPPSIEKINRSRLFLDMGIKTKFEPGINRMNSSPAPPNSQHKRFLIRLRNFPAEIRRALVNTRLSIFLRDRLQ
jgi:hypothetical protein